MMVEYVNIKVGMKYKQTDTLITKSYHPLHEDVGINKYTDTKKIFLYGTGKEI